MATLRDLANRLTAQAGGLNVQANAVKQNAASQIVEYIIRSTPVDTGKAIANWQVTLDMPSAVAIDPYIKGREGSTYEINVDQALQAAKAVIGAARPGQEIWIQNVLPYIQRLNEGWSTQNPGGFVEAAQLIGRKVIEQGLPNVG